MPLLFALALAGAALTGQSTAAVQTGRVSGQAIDAATQAPVSDARLLLLRVGPPSAAAIAIPSVTTDQDGRYVFDALPPGVYRIAVQKAGYVPPMNSAAMKTFELKAGEALENVNVLARKGATIAGRVLDPLGHVVIGASVTALLKPLLAPFGENSTNDLGEFRIYGLPAGEYLLTANPHPQSGVQTSTVASLTFYPHAGDAAAAQSIVVEAGKTVSDVAIQLISSPAFQLSGVVADESGAPIAGASLALIAETERRRGFAPVGTGALAEGTTDASGRFVITGVPAGLYTLTATTGAFGSGMPRWGAVPITVGNASIANLRIVVRKDW